MRRVLIVSSGGGHASQARLLSPAFDADLIGHLVAGADTLEDCNARTPLRAAKCFIQAFREVRRRRPDIVISTGALPGLLAVIAAKSTGARTIWIDSIANVRRLSLSGRIAKYIACHTFSQWPQVAEDHHVRFAGALL